MHVIRTRDWPQGAQEYLRYINRRALVPVDDVPSPIKPVRRPKFAGKAVGHPANVPVLFQVKKVSNGRTHAAGKVSN